MVTLSASVEDRPLLEAALRTETRLARRMETSRSPEQEIVVRLQGVHHEALGRVSIEDCPLLLCLGMLPDSRSYLVGWETLGHVLVATQPGTTDAEEHLAALIATLAGQSPPSQLQLVTVAGENRGCGSSTPCRTSVRSSILQILTLWRECSQASAQSWSEGSAQAKRRYQWKWCWL